MNEPDFLDLLTRQAEQANEFLSNARKWDRERWVCQRLLESLGVSFSNDEFLPCSPEPPDVRFRDANFEVFFVLDEGRRLNDEWRAELERRRSAFSLSELVRRDGKRRRISAEQLQQRLGPTLRKKASNYRQRDIDTSQLDLLAFVSFKQLELDLNTHFPPPTEYLRQGWRSLSLIGGRYARVLFAQPQAPDFLRQNLGRGVILDVGIAF